jgi:5-methylcytosine-specific restriction endonuclease McrA
MSDTSFDILTRAALWNSYGNKCFYCTEPLDWEDLEIDHILPERLMQEPEALRKVLTEYGLDAGFEVNGLSNLVPCHSRCNSRKLGKVFTKNVVLYYLSLTTPKVPAIQKEIDKLEKRKDKGKLLSKLYSALATNLIDVKELDRIVEEAKRADWSTKNVKIPLGVGFIDQVYDSFYLNSDVTALYDKPLLVGGAFYSLTLRSEKDEEMEVSTLREWQDAVQKGYRTTDNASFKMSFVFRDLDELLKAITGAKMPKLSFVSEPWLNISDVNALSLKILPDVEHLLSGDILAGKSVGDLVNEGRLKVTTKSPVGISIEFAGFETSLTEQFRADFNGDGIEDIFVQGWGRAIGGTLGYGISGYLTRYSNTGLLDYIRQKPSS